MFEKFVAAFGEIQNKQEISRDALNSVQKHLPEDLFSFIEKGAGSYMNGFLWTVNPVEYKQILDDVYVPLQEPSICFARDSFAGLYIWEDTSVIYVDINRSRQEVLGRKANVFFDLKMTDNGFLDKKLPYNKYLEAKEILGDLTSDECFGYQPLLGLGGSEKSQNLRTVKVKEYVSIISHTLGKIQ